ncbi:MAG: cytochrome c biogenesis protein CcsA [Bdellovibrionales bacterium]|nr:cytochrome c biogenesis protein CcsA [Bdellovibrionales bacterium]
MNVTYIKYFHVALVFLTMASVTVLFFASSVYVRTDYFLKIKKKKPAWMNVFPSLEKMHQWIIALFYVTFALLTVLVVNGIVYAHIMWGLRWLDQPKLLVSFATWVYFLVMFIFRIWKGFRGVELFTWLIIGCLFLSLSMYGAYAWQ